MRAILLAVCYTILGYLFGYFAKFLACICTGNEHNNAQYICAVAGGVIGLMLGIKNEINNAKRRENRIKNEENERIRKQQKEEEIIKLKQQQEEAARKLKDQQEKMAIDKMFHDVHDGDLGNRNYEPIIDQALKTYPQQESHINMHISIIHDILYRNAAETVNQPYDHDLETAFDYINDLKTILQFNEEAKLSLRHYDDFCSNSLKSVMSIWTDKDNIAENIKELTANANEHEDTYNKIKNNIKEARAYFESENFAAAFNKYAMVDEDEDFITKMKYCLLYFSVGEQHDAEKFNNLSSLHLSYFGCNQTGDNGKVIDKKLPATDYIIAQAFNYSRGGIINNINEILKFWLSRYNSVTIVKQYEILIKVFAYLKAYKQEEMVLEAMFTNGLPRTQQHENRLMFLKKGISDIPEIITENDKPSLFSYDYRSVKWKSNEVKTYFEALTMNHQSLAIPMVTEEWEHNITVNGFIWNVDKAYDLIKGSLDSEFGDSLACTILDAGPITDAGIDPIPSILVTPLNNNSRIAYPWAGILVVGDQMTASRITLSVYALFIPNNIISDSDNIAAINAALCSKMIVMKENQNPKIYNMITTIRSIITKVLEDWFNSGSVVDIYGN